jgi:hypothetical protein
MLCTSPINNHLFLSRLHNARTRHNIRRRILVMDYAIYIHAIRPAHRTQLSRIHSVRIRNSKETDYVIYFHAIKPTYHKCTVFISATTKGIDYVMYIHTIKRMHHQLSLVHLHEYTVLLSLLTKDTDYVMSIHVVSPAYRQRLDSLCTHNHKLQHLVT